MDFLSDTYSISAKIQDSKKLPYVTPALIKLELDVPDISSGGPNPGPDGTNGNLS